MNRADLSRRRFVVLSSLPPLALAVPRLSAIAAERSSSPMATLGVGAIGVGGRGALIANGAAARGRMIACADVDRSHAERFAAKHPRCEVFTDYRRILDRKDIQVVTIGTPDHWHAKIAIEAMLAGKDVYCEKPLTLTIDEGKLLRRAVRQTGRVLQVGTQQRSDRRFLTAVALARSGRLGKTLTATCFLGEGPVSKEFLVTEPPKELDWDMWLGQCPKVAYSKERCHGTFRWWLEYSGGKLTDWGAHHLDIAQWGIGCEDTGPIEIEGRGDFPVLPEDFDPVAFFAGKIRLPNAYNTAVRFQIELKFPNGSKIVVQHGPGNGVRFEGEKGEIFVSRGRLSGALFEQLGTEDKTRLEEEIRKLYKGRSPTAHMQNFFDCVLSRGEPVSDVASHHRILTSCHLCNIAMMLRRKLTWDPKKEDFIGDEQASALLSRPQRVPYTIVL